MSVYKRIALRPKCEKTLPNSNTYLSRPLPRSRSSPPLAAPRRRGPPGAARAALVLHAPVLHAPVVPSGDPRAPRRPALRPRSPGCHPPCPLLLLTDSAVTACLVTTQPAAAPSPVTWSTPWPSRWTRIERCSAPRWSRRRRLSPAHFSRPSGIWGSLWGIVGAVLLQTEVVADGAVPALGADDTGAGR